jgi:hypothetical protein
VPQSTRRAAQPLTQLLNRRRPRHPEIITIPDAKIKSPRGPRGPDQLRQDQGSKDHHECDRPAQRWWQGWRVVRGGVLLAFHSLDAASGQLPDRITLM